MGKRSARPETLFLAASVLLAIVLAAVGGRITTTVGEGSDGRSRPDFRLASLAGPEIGPEDFRGQVVLLDFWATWCVPCRFQEKILEEMESELADMGVQILAIDLGEDEETVRGHYPEELPPWPVLLDVDDRLTAELGIEALPSLMILDREGRIAYFEVGILDARDLRAQLELASSS